MAYSLFRVVVLTTVFLAIHGSVNAAQRTYVNRTDEKLVIWLRPVLNPGFGDWINSGELDPDKSWPVTVRDPQAQYEFVLEFPDSNSEKKRLGIKTVQSKAPLKFSVVRRVTIESKPRYDEGGRAVMEAPVTVTYDLVPEK